MTPRVSLQPSIPILEAFRINEEVYFDEANEIKRFEIQYDVSIVLPNDSRFHMQKTGSIFLKTLDFPGMEEHCRLSYVKMLEDLSRDAERVFRHFRLATCNYQEYYNAQFWIFDTGEIVSGVENGEYELDLGWREG